MYEYICMCMNVYIYIYIYIYIYLPVYLREVYGVFLRSVIFELNEWEYVINTTHLVVQVHVFINVYNISMLLCFIL